MTSQSPDPSQSSSSDPDSIVSLQTVAAMIDLGRRSRPQESAPELRARLKEEGAQRDHERDKEKQQSLHDRHKDKVLLYVTATIVGLMTLVAFTVVLLPAFPEDIRKWGALSLTSILSMAAGYLGGKATK